MANTSFAKKLVDKYIFQNKMSYQNELAFDTGACYIDYNSRIRESRYRVIEWLGVANDGIVSKPSVITRRPYREHRTRTADSAAGDTHRRRYSFRKSHLAAGRVIGDHRPARHERLDAARLESLGHSIAVQCSNNMAHFLL